MERQISASYDDVCRVCGELYIQAQLRARQVEESQIQLVDSLNSQLGAGRAEQERLLKELATLRTAYNELYGKRDSHTPLASG